MARETAKTTAAPEAPRGCACGCGETVERVFKQGHDQRLISHLAQDVVYHSFWDGTCLGILKVTEVKRLDMQDKINKVSAYVSTKLSESLAAKFESAAGRQWELEKSRDEREAAKAARKAENAAKPKRVRKSATAKAATPSEEAGDVAPAKPDLKIVKPTASNDDVDAAEAAADEATGFTLGQPVRVRVGKRTRNAKVTGMNRAGQVSAITYVNAGKDVVKTGDQFEIIVD